MVAKVAPDGIVMKWTLCMLVVSLFTKTMVVPGATEMVLGSKFAVRFAAMPAGMMIWTVDPVAVVDVVVDVVLLLVLGVVVVEFVLVVDVVLLLVLGVVIVDVVLVVVDEVVGVVDVLVVIVDVEVLVVEDVLVVVVVEELFVLGKKMKYPAATMRTTTTTPVTIRPVPIPAFLCSVFMLGVFLKRAAAVVDLRFSNIGYSSILQGPPQPTARGGKSGLSGRGTGRRRPDELDVGRPR